MADPCLAVGEENIQAFSSGSISSLQIALFSLKARCTKQQERISDLEGDNMVLNSSRTELYTEMNKLHEANVKLREKNLRLSYEMHMKSKENCKMKVEWDKDRSSIRLLERLQKDMVQRSARTIISKDDNIAITNYEVAKDASDDYVGEDKELKTLVNTEADTMSRIKQNLQNQQVQILGALTILQQKKTLSDQRAKSLISVDAVHQTDTNTTTTTAARYSPMCETVFPMESSQEVIGSQVEEHFSNEESNTSRKDFPFAFA